MTCLQTFKQITRTGTRPFWERVLNLSQLVLATINLHTKFEIFSIVVTFEVFELYYWLNFIIDKIKFI